MKMSDIVNETTSAGAVSVVVTPVRGMVSRQMKNANGTVKNALDQNTNIFGNKKKPAKKKKKA